MNKLGFKLIPILGTFDLVEKMILYCSRVGIPLYLKGIFVLFCPKIHMSPCDYFWLNQCPHTCWAARKKGQQV